MPLSSASDHFERVHAELRRVVGSSEFHASDRSRRFLEYIVEETLAGRADRIKAYNIATSVFGRDVWFDPQRDPVVRMEAGRLRRSLERFYLTAGKLSALKLLLPKGRDIPQFQDNVVAGALDAASNGHVEDAGELRPSICISPFEFEGDAGCHPGFATGFARDVMVALSHYPEFSIVQSGSDLSAFSRPDMPGAIGPAYLLAGGIALRGGVMDVKAILFDKAQRVLWGRHWRCKQQASNLLSIRNEVAVNLARDLAHPSSAIFKDAARVLASRSGQMTPFQSLARYHEYRRNYNRALFANLRSTLEHLVVANPINAEIAACLSQIYVAGFRFGFARSEPPAVLLNRAKALAHRAIETEPHSSRAHQALALIHWFDRECDESFRILEDDLARNPRPTEILVDIALYRCLKADWNKATPLLEGLAQTGSPLPLSYQIGLSLYHFARARFDLALAAARRIEATHVAHSYVAQAISLVRLDRTEEARHAISQILKLNPNFTLSNPLADLSGDNLEPGLSRAVATALVDAGFNQVFGETGWNSADARDEPEPARNSSRTLRCRS